MRLSNLPGSALALFVLLAPVSRAQTLLPVVSQPLPTVSAVLGQSAPTVALGGHLALDGVSNTVVQFDTVLGKFNVETLPEAAPLSVTNFLGYVNRGDYTNSLIHRSVPNFVIQGGGFTISGNSIDEVPAQAAIALEYNLPNTRGTLSMARSTALNSATSQWFINTVDNTTNLGQANNGGYAVFARVLGTGMTVVDSIAALTVYNASTYLGSSFGEMPLRGPDLTTANLALVSTVKEANIVPDGSAKPAVLSLEASSSDTQFATATIAGGTLTVTPVAPGVCTITVKATDTNGNATETSTLATVSRPLYVATQPQSQHLVQGGSATLQVSAVASASGGAIRWYHNGTEISGATGTSLELTNLQSAQAGIYMASITGAAGTAYSQPAVVGIEPAGNARTAGSVTTRDEWQGIRHPVNGNVYDQFLLTGTAGTIRTADGKIARISLIDENNSIVQFEMSGPGALTVVLANASGPKAPAFYNQAGIEYMQGAPLVVLTGATKDTHMSIYSVGRLTNPGVTRADVTYHEWATVRASGIQSTTGEFGGLYYGNVLFTGSAGPIGIAAPTVRSIGTLNFHEVKATGSGYPLLLLAADGTANLKVTGGSLEQLNDQPIAVAGLATVKMVAGQGSSGEAAPAQEALGRLVFDGADITEEVVVP